MSLAGIDYQVDVQVSNGVKSQTVSSLLGKACYREENI